MGCHRCCPFQSQCQGSAPSPTTGARLVYRGWGMGISECEKRAQRHASTNSLAALIGSMPRGVGRRLWPMAQLGAGDTAAAHRVVASAMPSEKPKPCTWTRVRQTLDLSRRQRRRVPGRSRHLGSQGRCSVPGGLQCNVAHHQEGGRSPVRNGGRSPLRHFNGIGAGQLGDIDLPAEV